MQEMLLRAQWNIEGFVPHSAPEVCIFQLTAMDRSTNGYTRCILGKHTKRPGCQLDPQLIIFCHARCMSQGPEGLGAFQTEEQVVYWRVVGYA